MFCPLLRDSLLRGIHDVCRVIVDKLGQPLVESGHFGVVVILSYWDSPNWNCVVMSFLIVHYFYFLVKLHKSMDDNWSLQQSTNKCIKKSWSQTVSVRQGQERAKFRYFVFGSSATQCPTCMRSPRPASRMSKGPYIHCLLPIQLHMK